MAVTQIRARCARCRDDVVLMTKSNRDDYSTVQRVIAPGRVCAKCASEQERAVKSLTSLAVSIARSHTGPEEYVSRYAHLLLEHALYQRERGGRPCTATSSPFEREDRGAPHGSSYGYSKTEASIYWEWLQNMEDA